MGIQYEENSEEWSVCCSFQDSLSQMFVALFNSTHLTLDALGSASSGASVGRLGSLPLSLVLQLGLLGVHALCAFGALHWLDWLLNTLTEIACQLKPQLSIKEGCVCA